jgi:hypothetical protein
MTHRSIFETIINKIRELLQSDEFLDAHRVEKHFIRKRLLSMYQVVLFLIYTTKQKMDTNIDSISLEETSKPTNKYRYQANRSYIIGRLKKLFPLFLGGTIKLQKILDLFNDARKVKSQIQPDRSNPRKKGGKSRERKHFKNRKCCV